MPSIALAATNADSARITAAAQAAGYPDIKTYIIAQVQHLVQQYEGQQSAITFSATYNPVGIT